jgi:N-methylhydantoinase B
VQDERTHKLGPVELTLYAELLAAACAEMDLALQRSAFSANIKERRDFSTALFDGRGAIITQGDNIPVHLGSMPASVQAVLARMELKPGDVAILNDPFAGGTHLPDITVVAPYFSDDGSTPIAFVANRAHHADVGGMTGGSLPLSTEIYQEGLIIPPLLLVSRSELRGDVVSLICANSRTPDERRGDIQAQLGALQIGLRRLEQIERDSLRPRFGTVRSGWEIVFDELLAAGKSLMDELIARLPESAASARQWLELPGGAETLLAVTLQRTGDRLRVDFSASDDQHVGPYNAVRAITVSAVLYILRCLLPRNPFPPASVLNQVDVVTRPGSLCDALRPAAVAAGNVETSQRLVDVLQLALAQLLPGEIPALSQGTMSNITIGFPPQGDHGPLAYYETIGGGHGGGPAHRGLSCRHAHMTNSLNTPVESLEAALPLRITRYGRRESSGGAGSSPGGDGIVRSYEFLAPGTVTLLAQRRSHGPDGIAGGGAGTPGLAVLLRGEVSQQLPGSVSFEAEAGDVLTIETPGGGGWGSSDQPL